MSGSSEGRNGNPGHGCLHPAPGLLSRSGGGVGASLTGGFFLLVLALVITDKTEKVI